MTHDLPLNRALAAIHEEEGTMATKGKSDATNKREAKDLTSKDSAAILGGAIVAVNGGNTPNGNAVRSADAVTSR